MQARAPRQLCAHGQVRLLAAEGAAEGRAVRLEFLEPHVRAADAGQRARKAPDEDQTQNVGEAFVII
ncbi:hypothetical protein PR002_g8516 [Phytophthora rubi]|uniref:Uncharacterized protein n=1 Tax=Phytophthora rubi TaxID=129364 RepID=A0A6A3MY67_9STRA|nr:hypothetical protein PR002_g8516 [Phytophthora rubi]